MPHHLANNSAQDALIVFGHQAILCSPAYRLMMEQGSARTVTIMVAVPLLLSKLLRLLHSPVATYGVAAALCC
jgi:hypothetical protein